MAEQYKARIAALEAELANRDTEIDGLRQAISKMPEFSKLDGDVCFKIEKDNDSKKKSIKEVNTNTVKIQIVFLNIYT